MSRTRKHLRQKVLLDSDVTHPAEKRVQCARFLSFPFARNLPVPVHVILSRREPTAVLPSEIYSGEVSIASNHHWYRTVDIVCHRCLPHSAIASRSLNRLPHQFSLSVCRSAIRLTIYSNFLHHQASI